VPFLSYAPGVFDSGSVLSAFEAETGVHLEPKDLREFDRWRADHPVGRQLPRVRRYDSPKLAEDHFGGHFSVRIFGRDDPDEGVRDNGLERRLPERGPQEYYVAARRNARTSTLCSGATLPRSLRNLRQRGPY